MFLFLWICVINDGISIKTHALLHRLASACAISLIASGISWKKAVSVSQIFFFWKSKSFISMKFQNISVSSLWSFVNRLETELVVQYIFNPLPISIQCTMFFYWNAGWSLNLAHCEKKREKKKERMKEPSTIFRVYLFNLFECVSNMKLCVVCTFCGCVTRTEEQDMFHNCNLHCLFNL